MIRFFFVLMLVLGGSLAACGGSKHVSVVENPYAESARSFAQVGVAVMGLERWDAAERTFKRELVAAQMADDTQAVVLAHYNLGSVRMAAGDRVRGRQQLGQCLLLARRYGFPIMAARASLALALDQARDGMVPNTPVLADIRASWPADVQLSAGRLALYRHDTSDAHQAYLRVLHNAGHDRAGVILKAKAHLGLAMVARMLSNDSKLTSELQQALALCRRAGAPRVAAEALQMLGSGKGTISDRKDALERSLAIYRALRDKIGQRRVLKELIVLTTGDSHLHWQQRLQGLDKKASKSPTQGSK